MITVDASKLKKAQETLIRLRSRLIQQINVSYKARVDKVFLDVLNVSPQWSGDYVANWFMVVAGQGLPGYVESPFKESESAKQKGDAAAVNYAYQASRSVSYNYKQRITFYNPTPLYFTGTTVTDNFGTQVRLRVFNLLSPAQIVSSYIVAKYR